MYRKFACEITTCRFWYILVHSRFKPNITIFSPFTIYVSFYYFCYSLGLDFKARWQIFMQYLSKFSTLYFLKIRSKYNRLEKTCIFCIFGLGFIKCFFILTHKICLNNKQELLIILVYFWVTFDLTQYLYLQKFLLHNRIECNWLYFEYY